MITQVTQDSTASGSDEVEAVSSATAAKTLPVLQPALFVAGLAAAEKLRGESPAAMDGCSVAAGLSLGEYTALVFAGALSFRDGLKVGALRSEVWHINTGASASTMCRVV